MADKMMRVSGRNDDGKARALRVGNSGNLKTSSSDQNNLLEKFTSNFQIGKNRVFYGTVNSGTTEYSRIYPLNYKDYSKKSVYVKNNFDVEMRITEFHKHVGDDLIEIVDVEINIPSEETGVLSFVEYPQLNEPFDGLSITLEGPYPTTGNIEIYWMGGND